MGPSPHRALALAFAAALTVAALVALARAHADGTVTAVAWLRHAGAAGVLAYLAAYFAGALGVLPMGLLAAVGGFVYGPLLGPPIAWLASVVAACGPFFVARYAARDRVARWLAHRPAARSVDAAIARGGLRVLVLMRATPLLPQNWFNYLFGLGSVRGRDYALASFIGLAPLMGGSAYLGALAPTAADVLAGRRPSLGPWNYALAAIAALVAAGAVAWIAQAARRELRIATQRASVHGNESHP